MKTGIHPTYFADATVSCACGATFVTGGTQESIQTEVCSACHPFYTGKQKLLDTAGKIDKFRAKMEAAKGVEKKASKISASVQAAAAKSAATKKSALASKHAAKKLTADATKAELEAAKAAEAAAATEAPAEPAAE